MEAPRGRPTVAARVAALALAIGASAGVVVVTEGPTRLTTYAGRSPVVAALTVAVGLGLAVAGLLVTTDRARAPLGWLAVLAGVTWFAPVWTAWHGGPPLLPSVAALLTGATFALVFHLMLAAPNGRIDRAVPMGLIVLVYLEAVAAAIVLALVRDPYLDPGCLANCIDNSFLVHSLPSFARTIESIDRWSVAAAAGVLVVVSLVRTLWGSSSNRRAHAPWSVAGLLFGGAVLVRSIQLLRNPVEDPFNAVLFVGFLVMAIALLFVSVGLTTGLVHARSQLRAVGRIAQDLGEAPAAGSVRAALAGILRDPDLQIVYHVADPDRYVDVSGRGVPEPVAAAGRTITRLVRDERLVAVVAHTSPDADLAGAIGPAVRLALENERLQAELLSELEELRDSRARIVATGDEERRRLERDLHDGAQQRLLALSYDVRLARAAAGRADEREAGALLEGAIEETRFALEELRELAHGIYPAVLSEGGLAAALATLADTARVPVNLKVDEQRCPPAAEAAAYFAVSEAVDDAVHRRATRIAVSETHRDGRLVVAVEDDGAERPASPVPIIDRVGAVGGDVVVLPTGIRVEIPCV